MAAALGGTGLATGAVDGADGGCGSVMVDVDARTDGRCSGSMVKRLGRRRYSQNTGLPCRWGAGGGEIRVCIRDRSRWMRVSVCVCGLCVPNNVLYEIALSVPQINATNIMSLRTHSQWHVLYRLANTHGSTHFHLHFGCMCACVCVLVYVFNIKTTQTMRRPHVAAPVVGKVPNCCYCCFALAQRLFRIPIERRLRRTHHHFHTSN